MSEIPRSVSLVRNIFLDTSVFRTASYNLQAKRFQSLLQLARDRKVFVKITDVTLHEVFSQIRSLLAAAQQEHNQFKKKAYILRSVSDPLANKLVEDLNFVGYEADLVNQINVFLLEAKVETIFIDEVVPSKIFDQYFLQKPPFSEKALKKSEFPDAFVIESLQLWCKNNQEKIYVVSGDNDFADACKNIRSLIHVPTLDQVIDVVITADKTVSEVKELIKRQSSIVTTAIEHAMYETQLYIRGESASITLDRIDTLTVLRESILEVESQFAAIQYQLEAIFTAEVLYPTNESDKQFRDIGELFQMGYGIGNITFFAKFFAEVWVQFPEIDPYHLSVEKIIINDGGGINVRYVDD